MRQLVLDCEGDCDIAEEEFGRGSVATAIQLAEGDHVWLVAEGVIVLGEKTLANQTQDLRREDTQVSVVRSGCLLRGIHAECD